ncbi:MAG: sulfatase family protein [Planctomycetota bacterium]|jgi:arylsulfatase A-like enzyme
MRSLTESRWGRIFLDARRAQDWDAARAWILRQREVPFFLFVHTYAIHDYRPSGSNRGRFGSTVSEEGPVEPLRNVADQVHTPYTPEERRQLVDLYDEAIREVDAEIGKLLDGLGELEQDTLVVVTSDHGEVLGEHAIEGQPVVGHGMSLWEELLRVPLVIHVPGGSPGRVVQPVSSVDVAPTLLDLLGIEVPGTMQGRSLRRSLEGGAVEGAAASPVLAELHSHRSDQRALYAGSWKLLTGDPQANVTWPVPAPRRLFDVAADPLEARDVGEGHPETAGRMEADLEMLVEQLHADRGGGPREVVLDEETRRRLEELGYVEGG